MLCRFSHVQLFATLLTVAHEAPLSMGFSRQEHWSGLPFIFIASLGSKYYNDLCFMLKESRMREEKILFAKGLLGELPLGLLIASLKWKWPAA